MKNKQPTVSRGDLYYADLSPVVGSEQGGLRPVVIIQNDIGNRHAPTVIVAPITSRTTKKPLPTHIPFCGCGLSKDSIMLMEQIRTIDKSRLKNKMGSLPPEKLEAVDEAIKVSLGLS